MSQVFSRLYLVEWEAVISLDKEYLNNDIMIIAGSQLSMAVLSFKI